MFFEDQPRQLEFSNKVIFSILFQNINKTVPSKIILEAVWQELSSEHTQYIRVYIGHLRKKIETLKPGYFVIKSESGVGYRLEELN